MDRGASLGYAQCVKPGALRHRVSRTSKADESVAALEWLRDSVASLLRTLGDEARLVDRDETMTWEERFQEAFSMGRFATALRWVLTLAHERPSTATSRRSRARALRDYRATVAGLWAVERACLDALTASSESDRRAARRVMDGVGPLLDRVGRPAI